MIFFIGIDDVTNTDETCMDIREDCDNYLPTVSNPKGYCDQPLAIKQCQKTCNACHINQQTTKQNNESKITEGELTGNPWSKNAFKFQWEGSDS